jgi:hypothetical protein
MSSVFALTGFFSLPIHYPPDDAREKTAKLQKQRASANDVARIPKGN